MTISDADFMAFKPMFDAIQLAVEKADCLERVGTIAAGLRMVADAIDPPPMVQVNRDLAAMLARPKRSTPPTSCASIVDVLGCRRIIARRTRPWQSQTAMQR